jgi:hypothetical protein
MRTDKEIKIEVGKLRKQLTLKNRWNASAREIMEAQVEVLEKRMTTAQIGGRWYEDETTEDYSDGDNELWVQADRAASWMNGEKGVDTPSKGAR